MTKARKDSKPVLVRKAWVYTRTSNKKQAILVRVMTPEEIRRSLGLSKTAKLRVERAIRRAGLRLKAS